jgi:secreted PhoX family phosphatase
VKNNKQTDPSISEAQAFSLTRRKFVRGAATVAAIAATVPLEPIFREKETTAEAAPASNSTNSNAADRANDCFNYRKNMA